MTKEKTTNEEEYDICISCGKVTSYKKTDNVIYRSGYIEGAGQLCFICTQTKKLHESAYQLPLGILKTLDTFLLEQRSHVR